MNYLTTDDVCKILHMSRKTAYKLFKLKGFPYIKIGREYLVEENKLKSFLEMYENTTIFLNN